jgi:hypothetical protein
MREEILPPDMRRKTTPAEMLVYTLKEIQASIDDELYALAGSYIETADRIKNQLECEVSQLKIDNIYVNMEDLYNEINNAAVTLEVDGTDLVIRIQYLEGDAEDIKEHLESNAGDAV